VFNLFNYWAFPTMGNVVVGGSAKPPEGYQVVWICGNGVLLSIFGDGFLHKKFMKRIFIIALLISALGCKEKKERVETASQTAQVTAARVKNDLPDMQITLVDGNVVDLKTLKSKTVVVLFQPDCDHCQHEAEEIKANLDRFKNQTMYFVSSSPVDQIVKFSKDYKLNDQRNIYFGATTVQKILDTFGPIAAPSIYIYSESGQLVQKFNGQTPVAEIVQYL
jgi:peroxiredoxin